MANPTTISNLPALPLPIGGGEFVPVVQNGETYKATAEELILPGQVGGVVGGIGISTTKSDGVVTVALNNLIANIAALRALLGGAAYPIVYVEGYYIENDGGQGVFFYTSSDTTSADNGGTIIVDADGHRYYRPSAEPISVKWFGAKGDGVTDDHAAIMAAFSVFATVEATSTGGPQLFFPNGRYLCNSPLVFDYSPVYPLGGILFGAGMTSTIIDLRNVKSTPALLITALGPNNQFDYVKWRDIGIETNLPGVGVSFCSESILDAMNEAEFNNISIGNYDLTDAAVGAEINYCLNCFFNMVCGAAGVGVGLRITAAKFNVIQGSYGSLGGTGVYITGNGSANYTYANVFQALDIENTATAVTIDATNASTNTFIGGQWGYTSAGINATAGYSNYIINPNNAGAGGSFVAGSVGITIKSRSLSVITPTMPTTTTDVANTQGMDMLVTISGGTVTAVDINSVTYSTTGGMFFLPNNGVINITYSAAPTWTWQSLA